MGLIIPHNDPISRSGPVLKVLGRMGLWGWGGHNSIPSRVQGEQGGCGTRQHGVVQDKAKIDTRLTQEQEFSAAVGERLHDKDRCCEDGPGVAAALL